MTDVDVKWHCRVLTRILYLKLYSYFLKAEIANIKCVLLINYIASESQYINLAISKKLSG